MQTSESRGEPIAVPFVLGRWQVDPERNTVRGPDGRVCLEPKMMAVLTRLAAAPGVTLSKDHLLEHVWPRRYVVEGVLKRVVSELRRVLNDDARQPRYIETVYKVGYRLIRTPRCADDGVERSSAPFERATVESYTINHTKKGSDAVFIGRNSDGERVIGNADLSDEATSAAFSGGEPFGLELSVVQDERGRNMGRVG